jgi:4-diphosphocytidyl-2-C-methyl-D-erythritol kinase
MPTCVRSYSKINLGLAIGPTRPDGFHGLATLYQTLALHDLVTISARPAPATSITLTTNHPFVPTDARNTAWKMIDFALTHLGLTAEVAIHIEKQLPIQGGMGAGSANAAAALLGLERELNLDIPPEIRLALAAQVGSDVPLFLIGGTILGTSRGEQVQSLPDLPPTPCVIAIPEVRVSTPRAFHDWDLLTTKRGLTESPQPDRLEELSLAYSSIFSHNENDSTVASDTSGIVRGRSQDDTLNGLAGNPLLALVRTGIENDFEQVVFLQYPLLREIKHELMGIGSESPAVYAALSGSGSALFGLYRSEADAEAAQQRVLASGCKVLRTNTLPRPEYWRTMFAE